MRKSKFSETQIVAMLKDAESGVPVADLLRKHGVSKATFLSGAASTAARPSRT
jgi:putative transposase